MDDYHKIFIPAYDNNNTLKLAIRAYYVNNELSFLIVDPHSLYTSCVAAKDLKYRKPDINQQALSRYTHIDELAHTPYYQALHHYNSGPVKTENHGLQQASRDVQGCFLTIDLCPSNNNFEQKLFEKLIELSRDDIPTPVAICVSGLWIITHPNEFIWLCQQHNNRNLDITWVNHSLTHPYYPGLDNADNFLNFRHDNFEREILDTEKMLLTHDIIPSVFFRFPGLISNAYTINKLKQYGLIPLGSSAWLSKGEPIHNGSIILIHANGNEVSGVVDNFIETLNSINLLPLAQTLIYYKSTFD